LTPEQQAELEAARQAQITTRAELRDVQFQLRKDIEGLGTRIKAVNILLVPALVGVAALALAGVRAARRRGERLRASATG
ncbi:MAG: ABC transporter, partial [Planctomyces sp.]